MNDSEETSSPAIKALIVFREDGDTDNLFVPILCDAIRAGGIDVRCSTKEFWESDKTYDIIHFQWPEEVAFSSSGIMSSVITFPILTLNNCMQR